MKRAFISYSRDSQEHLSWVTTLVQRLSQHTEVIFDQKMEIGDNKDVFMEQLAEADFIIPVLTPEYHRKVKERSSGVGFEFSMILDYVQNNARYNTKVLPVLRRGEIYESIPVYLRQLAFLDLRNDQDFEMQLERLIRRVSKEEPSEKSPHESGDERSSSSTTSNIQTMENKIEYAGPSTIKSELHRSFEIYFEKYFSLSPENVRLASRKIEKEVDEYKQSFEKQFSAERMEKYQRRQLEFRDKVVAEHLWTVNSALRSREEELMRYRAVFKRTKPADIYAVVSSILRFGEEYKTEIWPAINPDKVSSIEDLRLEGLSNDDLALSGTIGLGIRSEILHKQHPGVFPMMTRRSQWGMHFLAGNAMEFLRYEYDIHNERSRIVNQFEYDYARFTFYSNYISVLLKNKLTSLQVPWNENIRFGYANLFISHVFDLNKDKYRDLREWK